VPLFETERLIVRKLSHQDVPVLTTILSDPEVMRFSVRGVCDEAATLKFVDWCLDSYASHGIGPWALCVKESGDFIGFCGIGPEYIDGVEEINLGYRLAHRFWQQGYATEAVKGVLQYAFGQKIGVNGTPNIIMPDGSVIPGYQPPKQLEQALKAIL